MAQTFDEILLLMQMWDSNLRDKNLISFWPDEGGILSYQTANVSKMPSWDTIGKIMETKRRLDSLELRKKEHFAPKLVEDAMPVMSPRLLNSLLINWHLFKLVSLVFLEWIASIHWIPYSDFGCSLRGNERQIFPANYPAHTLIIRVECSW